MGNFRRYVLVFFVLGMILNILSAQGGDMKINDIQIIASHNSYRKKTYRPIFRWVIFFRPLIPKQYDPRSWDYSHVPIPEQLENYRVRGLELDIYYDPQGGHYYKRKGNWLVFQSAKSQNTELQNPGFKLIHIPDIDYNSHYTTFKEALAAIKAWSDAHQGHTPIFVNVEIKNSALGDYIPLKILPKAIPFTVEAADFLDAEIKSVFGEGLKQVFTPDKFRQGYPNLNEVVKAGKVPFLEEAQGKIFFIADGCEAIYAQGHPALAGRVMFTYAPPRSPECAFIIANDPIRQADSIRHWVKEGYMVRTRCDSDTYQARKGDYSTQQAAFDSGAQILSTDYYQPDKRYLNHKKWSSYFVEFPQKAEYRKNPIRSKEP